MILGQTLDINGNIIQKAKFEPLASDPSAASYLGSLTGAIYYNTTSGVNRIHNGTEWVNITKIQGTGNNITVTYSGNPLVATLTLDSGIDAAKIANGTVSNTEFQYLDNVTSNIQTQLNSKASTASLTAYQTRSEKGATNGYASLDSNGKVPTTQLPEEILGNMAYKGTWNATTNSPSITTASSVNKGWYYIVTVSGTSIPSGLNPTTSASIMAGTNKWNVGDWIVSDGTYWDKIDNTDQVMSVFGRMGTVIAQTGDYTASQITNTPSGGLTATNVQNALYELNGELSTLTSNAVVTNPTATQTIDGYALEVKRASAGLSSFSAKLSTDAQTRTAMLADGPIVFGDGTNAADTNLYRAEANHLKTNDLFSANNIIVGNSSTTADYQLLKFDTERAWAFLKTGTGLNTNLELADLIGSKSFYIGTNGNQTAKFQTATTEGSRIFSTWGRVYHNSLSGVGDHVAYFNSDGRLLRSSSITTTELGYLDGTSANIQDQINNLSNAASNAVVTNPTAPQTIIGQQLKLDDGAMTIVRGLSTNFALNTYATGDAQSRMVATAGGTLSFGDGTNSQDVSFGRRGVGIIGTGNKLEAGQNVRATGYDGANLTGPGVEMHLLTGDIGRILSYNRDSGTRLPLKLEGSEVQFAAGSGVVYATVTSSDCLTVGFSDTAWPIQAYRTNSANGASAGVRFDLKNSANAKTTFAGVQGYIISNVAGSENGGIKFRGLKDSVEADIMRWSPNGLCFGTNIVDPRLSEWLYIPYTESTKSAINAEYLSSSVGTPIIQANSTGNSSSSQALFNGRAQSVNRFTVFADGSIFSNALSTNAVVVTDGSKNLVSSSITTTELNYLDNATSNIQAQLNKTPIYTQTESDLLIDTQRPGFYRNDSNKVSLVFGNAGLSNVDYIKYDDSLNTLFFQADRPLASTDAPTMNIYVGEISASSLTVGNVNNTEFQYLDGATSNIQDQINNIKNGTSTRYSTTINIVAGVQSFTITHNLGYLRPTVMVVDEVSDREIITTPIYTSTTQLSIPITSSQAFTGARVEVSI